MILGAGAGQLPLIRRAKAAGREVIAVSPEGDYPGFAEADGRVYCDLSDKEKILSAAKDLSIDAIASDQTDLSVPAVQYVAESLGLPHIECEDIDRFRHKHVMRQVCLDCGIPTIPFCVTDNPEEGRKALSGYGKSAILKPDDSQGSRGVHKIDGSEGFESAFEDALKHSKSGKVIVEKFIEGHELEVDSVIHNGEMISALVGDVYNFDVKDTFSSFERIYPASLDKGLYSQVVKYNEAVIKALGLSSGWTHGEYILTDDGKIFLLEIGARGGGNFIGSDIVRIMMGMGTDEMSFRTAIGDESFYGEVKYRDEHCAYKCFYLPEGRVKDIDVSDELLARKCLVAHNLDHIHKGQEIFRNTDKTGRYTLVIKADSRAALIKEMKDIENMIHISVEDTEGNVRGIIWR